MNASRYILWKVRWGRVLGTVWAAFLLLLLGPLMLLLALLVKLTSRGPVLYSPDRLGRDGKSFRMHKFRTMHVNAPEMVSEDGKRIVGKRDPRFTAAAPILRVGLDELPQLINIVMGQMLLIGPRPDTVDMLDAYTPEERPRLMAAPGITGLSQVLDGRHLTNAYNYALDAYYVEHGSPWMDLMILAYTMPFMLGRRSVGIHYLRRIMPEAAAHWDRHRDDDSS